jgi:SAM-dependent methyltransferase
MEWVDDQRRIAGFYDRLVDQFGHSPQASNASSRRSLEIRYRILAEAADLRDRHVLGVGCAFGDMGVYLQERFPGVRYEGIDVSSRMIEEGQRVHPGLDLRCQNVLDMNGLANYDAILTEGIFYLLGDDAERKMQTLLEKMFTLTRGVLAVGTLSTWAPHHEPGEFYADPVRLFEWCRRLTPRVLLRHDYLPHDFTLYLYKPDTELRPTLLADAWPT